VRFGSCAAHGASAVVLRMQAVQRLGAATPSRAVLQLPSALSAQCFLLFTFLTPHLDHGHGEVKVNFWESKNPGECAPRHDLCEQGVAGRVATLLSHTQSSDGNRSRLCF